MRHIKIRMIHIVIACFICSVASSYSQEIIIEPTSSDTGEVSLLFLGDVMGHDTQIAAARRGSENHYDYSESFYFVKDIISSADLAIANLEVTLAGPPYKGYPEFSSPDQLAIDLQQAGVDVMVTANNHSCDKRAKGIVRTIDVLDSLGIAHTGTFKDSVDLQKNHPLIINKNGIRIALLNYTYGTNGIPIPAGKFVNIIDSLSIQNDIRKSKQLQPDMIIAFVHWGDEYVTSPNKKQKGLAKFMHDQGVDMIIGSHPHVLQPFVWQKDSLKNQLTIYSMGNFVSGQRTAPRDGGAMVRVTLKKTHEDCIISNAGYILTYVHYPYINGLRHFMVVPVARIEQNSDLVPPGNAGWGRLKTFAAEARTIMDHNHGIHEITNLPKPALASPGIDGLKPHLR